MKILKRSLCIIAATLFTASTSSYHVLAQVNGLSLPGNEIYFYDPRSQDCTPTTVGGGGDVLDGYSLPATKGRVGTEEAINDNGQVPSTGGRITFADLLKDVPKEDLQYYKDYYITMRWNYTSWNWNGTSVGSDSDQIQWMRKKPRLVLVTNQRTGKSIIAAALEAGPAPWTGVDRSSNNAPKQGWVNPQKGTPEGYTGRVGGFPPVAMQALDVKPGMYDGSGDVLNFSWAPNQNLRPGPLDGSNATVNSPKCNNQNGGFVNAEGYAWPVGIDKINVSNGYKWPCPGICHHDNTPAFDLAHKETVLQRRGSDQDAKTAGAPVYAIFKGKISGFSDTYKGQKGCVSFQLVGDDGYKYWYGHISNPTVQNGQQVDAGQQIAQIGERRCTGNGSYPHLHIDRGSPKGHYGGSDCCRDPQFVPLINSLYESLR